MSSIAAIKAKVSIGQPFVVAGSVFSLDTLIENLHSEDIEVVHLLYHIPYQMCWIAEVDYAASAKRRKSSWWRSKFTSASSRWKDAVSLPGTEMIFASSETLQNGTKAPVMTILSGEAGSYSFKGLVPHWLFLTGGKLSFPGKVIYRCAGKEHSFVFEVELTVRPPLLANATGAVIGAVVGCGAKSLKDSVGSLPHMDVQFFATITLAAFLSTIAVIYSSRRTGDSQPILTVEDFWGGFLVGFTIGYVGNHAFEKFFPLNEKPQ